MVLKKEAIKVNISITWIVVSIVLFISPSLAISYYVDFENGNDSNSGIMPDSAWKHSPGDVNAIGVPLSTSLKAGDTVLFKGGVVYKGTIDLRFSGAAENFISYKGDSWPGREGQKAIISGFENILQVEWRKCESQPLCGNLSNWEHIYYASLTIPAFFNIAPASQINLYQDNRPLSVSQYPDALNVLYPMANNFFNVSASNMTSTTLIDSRLSQFGEGLVGKYVYLWVNPNVIVIRKILTYDAVSQSISFSSAQVYTDRNTRYALVNLFHDAVLSRPGEYYLDESVDVSGKGRIYVWPLEEKNLANDAQIEVAGRVHGIVLGPVNYVNIGGFLIRGQAGDSYSEGAAIIKGSSARTKGIIIRNNEVTATRSEGIGLISIFNAEDLIIENNHLHDTGDGARGIQAGDRNVSVRNNTLRNIGGTGIYLPGCYNCLIDRNNILDIGAVHANGISVYQGANNVTVSRNVVINSNIAYTFENSQNVHAYNNLFHGSDKTTYVVAAWGGMSGENRLMNNAILGSTNDGSLLLTSNQNVSYVVKNNILDGGGGGDRANNIYTSLCWWQSARYNWSSGIGESIENDLSKIFVDNNPVLGDFRLKPNSSAIDSGADLSPYFNADIAGVLRPQGAAWDIGPYEYTNSTYSATTSFNINNESFSNSSNSFENSMPSNAPGGETKSGNLQGNLSNYSTINESANIMGRDTNLSDLNEQEENLEGIDKNEKKSYAYSILIILLTAAIFLVGYRIIKTFYKNNEESSNV